MKQDFYAFFLPAAISNRRSAINAIVAGVIAGSLLTLATGVVCAVCFLRGAWNSQTVSLVATMVLVLAILTFGIWKHILPAAVLGVFVGMAIIGWVVWRGEVVAAIILAVPFVGGFATAVRGILALERIGKRDSTFDQHS